MSCSIDRLEKNEEVECPDDKRFDIEGYHDVHTMMCILHRV